MNVAILGYTSSSRQIDGEQARITYEFPFSHVPCGAEEVVCQIVGTDRQVQAKQRIEVTGCEQ